VRGDACLLPPGEHQRPAARAIPCRPFPTPVLRPADAMHCLARNDVDYVPIEETAGIATTLWVGPLLDRLTSTKSTPQCRETDCVYHSEKVPVETQLSGSARGGDGGPGSHSEDLARIPGSLGSSTALTAT
jgi:hypothetical protein